MKNLRRPLVAVSMIAAVAMLATATAASAAIPSDMQSLDSSPVSVYATSYVSTGATATINGDVVAGLYLTAGADSTINGDTSAGGATTLGAEATALKICSEGATTLGALAAGNSIYSGGATTLGALATANAVESVGAYTASVSADVGDDTATVVCVPPPADAAAIFTTLLDNARGAVGGMPATDPLTLATPGPLAGSISGDVTYAPGVYDVSGMLTVAAGVTITLDADFVSDAEFIFDISSYLAVGAGVNVEVVNAPGNPRVIWNVGGYATVGAGANISGTVMTGSYVTMGVDSAVTGSRIPNGSGGFSCLDGGAVYSLAAYVSLGAGATVGSTGGTC
ncbi:MAG: hypothetical protein ACI81L_003051 [Verrucomicrobiales bacterium]|jgi:hypothetical protein